MWLRKQQTSRPQVAPPTSFWTPAGPLWIAVSMAALVFKVGALALKTLAKPLGDRFKNWVMTHPQYRQTVLSAAQVSS